MEERKSDNIREHHRKFRQRLTEWGDMLRGQKMPALTEELFSLFEKTGNRLKYENVYFARRRFLAVFGLLTLWEKRPEDTQKLTEILEEICKEETWALPAHVDRKDEDWRRTVDLFASETAQALSQILSMAGNILPEETAEKVRYEVIHRVLDSYMGKTEGEWGWETSRNNWAAVCGGSIGSAALYLLDEEPERQAQIIKRVCHAFSYYLEGMYDDGTCPEGLGYFSYGMSYFIGFARQLKEHPGYHIDLMDSEKVRRIARFQQKGYFPKGNTVSFSDGSRRGRYRLGLTCYLARTIPGVELPDIRWALKFDDDNCYRFMSAWQDDLWTREYLTENPDNDIKAADREWFSLLPDAQWAIWNRDGIGIALKGGHNGESHNHNDVGSFLITADGEIFLTDLGSGEYTKEYFRQETRYSIFCNRSAGHSVPLINGEEQKPGESYRASSFFSGCPGCVKMEYAGAYTDNPQFRLLRTLEWTEGAKGILLTDNISGKGAVSMEENLVTQIKPVIDGNQVLLQGKKNSMRILFPKEYKDLRAEKEIFCNHRGVDEDVWRLRLNVPVRDGEGNCQISFRFFRL